MRQAFFLRRRRRQPVTLSERSEVEPRGLAVFCLAEDADEPGKVPKSSLLTRLDNRDVKLLAARRGACP